MAVRILNPISGTSEFTTDKRAKKYVESGMADRVGSAIRFRVCHQRESAAIDHTRGHYDKASHSGRLTMREAKAIPFAGNVARLGLSA